MPRQEGTIASFTEARKERTTYSFLDAEPKEPGKAQLSSFSNHAPNILHFDTEYNSSKSPISFSLSLIKVDIIHAMWSICKYTLISVIQYGNVEEPRLLKVIILYTKSGITQVLHDETPGTVVTFLKRTRFFEKLLSAAIYVCFLLHLSNFTHSTWTQHME